MCSCGGRGGVVPAGGGGVLIGSSSQAAEAAPPRQSVHWAAAGLTPQPETGDMRCHYPFIETTPTHHTFGGAFLPSFSTHQQLTISFTKSIDTVCQSAISFINITYLIHFRISFTHQFAILPFTIYLHFAFLPCCSTSAGTLPCQHHPDSSNKRAYY